MPNPNFADANIIFDNDFNALLNALNGIGVLSGWTTAAHSPTNMSVDVAAGSGYVDTSKKETTGATNLTIDASDATKARRDIVIWDTSAGALAVVKGTMEAILPYGETNFKNMTNPKPPDLPAGDDILVAEVYIRAGTSAITDSDIWDKRFFLAQTVHAAHASRHDWLGADVINTRLFPLGAPLYFGDWRTRDGWTNYVSGTGSVTWDGITQVRINTGTTSGSHAATYTSTLWGWSPDIQAHPFLVRIRGDGTSFADSIVRLYAMESGATKPPTDTGDHIGWKIINGRIWASNANGTTETATDTGIDLVAGGVCNLIVRPTGGSGEPIEFYINDVLKATHSTNLLQGYDYFIWFGIVNSVAVGKRARILTVQFSY